jgi:hypothetical protein
MGRYGPPMQLTNDGRSDESSDVELPEKDGDKPAVNVNERRTHRGIYAVLKEFSTEEISGLAVMIKHVGLADALFGDHVTKWKEAINWVLEGRLAIVAGIHFQGELVGRDLCA